MKPPAVELVGPVGLAELVEPETSAAVVAETVAGAAAAGPDLVLGQSASEAHAEHTVDESVGSAAVIVAAVGGLTTQTGVRTKV
jgi:hypothetical protein